MLLFRLRKGLVWGALVSAFSLNTYGVLFRNLWWCNLTQVPLTLILGLKIYGSTFNVNPVANHRALKLLLKHLTPKQRREFIWTGRFHVRGQDGRTYTIKDKAWANVRQDRVTYCIHSKGVPTYDSLLAQKLLIETNIAHFWHYSNRWLSLL